MAKVKRIERKQADVIVKLALEAATKVLECEGLTVEQVGCAGYTMDQVTFKIRAMVSGRVDAANTNAAAILGFSENIIGKSFKIRRTTHTIMGINLNRPKYPISTETENGAKYKFPVDDVKRRLGMK